MKRVATPVKVVTFPVDGRATLMEGPVGAGVDPLEVAFPADGRATLKARVLDEGATVVGSFIPGRRPGYDE